MNAHARSLESATSARWVYPPDDNTRVCRSGDEATTAEVHHLPWTGGQSESGRRVGVLGNGAPVTTFDHQLPPPRNAEVEALWFALCKDGFKPTAVVAVPPLSGEVARAFAMDIARTGAALTQTQVHVVNTVGLEPAAAVQAVGELPALRRDPTMVVADAPSVNTSGLPVFDAVSRTLLIAGKARSEVAEAEALIAEIGVERIIGSVIIDVGSGAKRPRRLSLGN